MSHLSDKQIKENKERFLKHCDNAIDYWSEKGNKEQVEYFKNLKNKAK